MLDHDELLPEEQASPDFVQELQIAYQMKPEEKQVLTRVHERLAQRSHPHPLLEPVQAGGHPHTRSPQLPPTVSPPSRSTTSRQRWLRHLNALVAALFVGLLVATMVFTFSSINRTSPCHSGIDQRYSCVAGPSGKGQYAFAGRDGSDAHPPLSAFHQLWFAGVKCARADG